MRSVLIVLALVLAHFTSTAAPPAVAEGFKLAPYLQVTRPDSVVVQWRTELPAYGWVEYGSTPDLGSKAETVELGLKQANVTHHRITLQGLKPGMTYYYRACAKPILSFKPYKVDYGTNVTSAVASFRTLPAQDQPVRAIIFNDLHNRVPTFEAMLPAVTSSPFDFSIFNGDCLADPNTEEQALTPLSVFNAGVNAESRPVFYIRGNHETRGAYARALPALVAWPENKPYFGFNAGPARFLVLDCGEDKPDENKEYSGLVNFTSFRKEQTEWLKTELKSRDFRNATWRVLVVHIPLYATRTNGGYSMPSHQLWAPMLEKARIDLALSAHLHRVAFHPAKTVGNPFPFYIGGGNRPEDATAMVLEATRDELSLRVLDRNGKEAVPSFVKKK